MPSVAITTGTVYAVPVLGSQPFVKQYLVQAIPEPPVSAGVNVIVWLVACHESSWVKLSDVVGVLVSTLATLALVYVAWFPAAS